MTFVLTPAVWVTVAQQWLGYSNDYGTAMTGVQQWLWYNNCARRMINSWLRYNNYRHPCGGETFFFFLTCFCRTVSVWAFSWGTVAWWRGYVRPSNCPDLCLGGTKASWLVYSNCRHPSFDEQQASDWCTGTVDVYCSSGAGLAWPGCWPGLGAGLVWFGAGLAWPGCWPCLVRELAWPGLAWPGCWPGHNLTPFRPC